MLLSHSPTSLYLAVPRFVNCLYNCCNSFYYKLPKFRLQLIHNSLARTVVKAPKSCHITPIINSLHWLEITERIEYKLLSLTYKVLTTTQPPYLHNPTLLAPRKSFDILALYKSDYYYLCSTSSQYSLFIRRYSCSATGHPHHPL